LCCSQPLVAAATGGVAALLRSARAAVSLAPVVLRGSTPSAQARAAPPVCASPSWTRRPSCAQPGQSGARRPAEARLTCRRQHPQRPKRSKPAAARLTRPRQPVQRTGPAAEQASPRLLEYPQARSPGQNRAAVEELRAWWKSRLAAARRSIAHSPDQRSGSGSVSHGRLPSSPGLVAVAPSRGSGSPTPLLPPNFACSASSRDRDHSDWCRSNRAMCRPGRKPRGRAAPPSWRAGTPAILSFSPRRNRGTAISL